MENVPVLITIPELEMNKKYLDEIAGIAPEVEVRYEPCETVEETTNALESDVQILYTYRPPANIENADELEWVQVHFSGVTHIIDNPIFNRDNGVVVTNVAGAHAPAMGEYCITVMPMLARGFLQLFHDKQTKTMNRDHSPPVDLWDQTIGIIGYGRTGREVGRLANTHQMRILALKRTPERNEVEGYSLQGAGDPKGKYPEQFFGPDELHQVLQESDFVVTTLPYTSETKDFFGVEEFERMKESAYFINVGRGETVAEGALVAALHQDEIAGAALDVFRTDPDPLPPDDPHWEVDDLFISPHISGTRHNEKYLERTTEIFCANLRQFLKNKPLYNVTTREQGY